jgi:hypothetical protein
MTWRLERHAFVVCVLLVAFPLRVTSFDVPHATWYANTYCGARYINIAGWRGCPRDTTGQNPNWYSPNYYCWDPNGTGSDSADAKTNCDESMVHHNRNCYTEAPSYSDCANFVSQIIQAGCGGLCQSQPDLFSWCGSNEDVYFSVFDCERWYCQGVGRYVAQRVNTMWYNILTFSGWWHCTGVSYPGNPYICDAYEGDVVLWDWTNNGTWDHIMYLNYDNVQWCGDEIQRGHSSDRCACNQLSIRQTRLGLEDCDNDGQEDDECTTYAVYRWYGNPSSDPLYSLRWNRQ